MAVYSEFEPKPYRQQIANLWWLERMNYLKFILREFSSIFVAYFLLVTLCMLSAMAGGRESYLAFRQWMASPLILLLNVITLAFMVFHAYTWTLLVPRAMLPRWHGKALTEKQTALPGFVAWGLVSLIVAIIVIAA